MIDHKISHKISFCITCKGRLHHLRETLPQNLRNASDYPNAEFVVLDYDSHDGLGEWIKQNFQEEMKSGKIRYARFEPAEYFEVGHAKNLSHRVATGEILCNLDADNIIAHGFANFLNEQFNKDKDIYVRPHRRELLRHRVCKKWLRGAGGRIALHRDNFLKLHGYDERFKDWGNDDPNLDARAGAAGLKRVDIPYNLLGDVIQHSSEERVAHLAPREREVSVEKLEGLKGVGGIVKRLREFNGPRGEEPPPANPDGNFGVGTLRINFGEDVTLAPIPPQTTTAHPENSPTERKPPDSWQKRHKSAQTASDIVGPHM